MDFSRVCGEEVAADTRPVHWLGDKHAAVCRAIGISRHTVDMHWRHIQIKLGHKGIIPAIHRIHEVLLEERVSEATAPAIEAATKPLLAEIETLHQRLREAEE